MKFFSLFKRFFQSIGLISSVLTVASTLAASGFAAISLILITRQLGPQEFGYFSIAFAFIQIIVRITDFGLTSVIQKYTPHKHHQSEIQDLFSYVIQFKLKISVISWLLGLCLFLPITYFIRFDKPLLIFLAFGLSFATSFFEIFVAMLQAIQKYAYASLVNIGQSIIKLILAGILLITKLSTDIVFVIYASAPIFPFIFYKVLFPSWMRLNLSERYTEIPKKISKFAAHASVAYVSAGIIENLDVIFLQYYRGTYEAGVFSGVSRVALLFSMIGYALASVLNTRASKYTKKEDLKAFLKKCTGVALLSLLGYLLILPFIEPLIFYSIGSQFLSGASVLHTLMASSFLTILIVPFMSALMSFDRHHFFSLSGILQIVILIGGNLLFTSQYGIDATGWIRLVTRVFLLFYTLYTLYFAYKAKFAKES